MTKKKKTVAKKAATKKPVAPAKAATKPSTKKKPVAKKAAKNAAPPTDVDKKAAAPAKKAPAKKSPAKKVLTSIEKEIMELTLEHAHEKGEARQDYLTRLCAAALFDPEEAEALSTEAIGWCVAFKAAPKSLEPADYLKELEVAKKVEDGVVLVVDEDSTETSKPKKIKEKKLAKPQERKPRLEPAASGHCQTYDFRRHVILNSDMPFGEAFQTFQEAGGTMSHRSATTVYYQTQGTLRVLIAEKLLLTPEGKEA